MWRKTNDGRMNYPEYPERAYEEGLVNALIHRDYLEIGSEVHIDIYDDRMEIVSPGGMPSGKRVQELDLRQVSSMRRNPVIADLFQRLVPRPVEAVHCELDRGRVHGEHGGLDPKAVPLVGPVSELRGDPREVVVHLPVEILRHRGRACRVRVGERVAPRHGHAHRRPERLVRLRDVADGVERLGLRNLAVEHRRGVALRRERAADDLVLRRRLGDELARYDVDNLTDDGVYCLRCFRVGCFHTHVGYTVTARKATLKCIPLVTNGMLVFQ